MHGGPQSYCIVHPGSDLTGSKFRFGEASVEIESPQTSGSRCEAFAFNQVFPPKTPQEKIFQDIAKQPVLDVLERFQSAAFLAFGSTGGGKTFSVTGGAKRFADRGLIPRSISALFEALSARADRDEYQVTVTFYEIYKDSVVDLLSERRRRITVQTEGAATTLLGLVKQTAATESDAYHLLFQGDSNRHFERFPLNPETSRGHVFYILNVTHLPTAREASLSFIDLATGISTKNNATAAIEKGLRALKAVASAMRVGRKPPFDDSLLTQILRPILEADSMGQRVNLSTILPIKYIEQLRRDVFEWLQFSHIFHEAIPSFALVIPPHVAQSLAPPASVVPMIAAPIVEATSYMVAPSVAAPVPPSGASVAPSALSARAALGMDNPSSFGREDGSYPSLAGAFGGGHLAEAAAYPQGVEGSACARQAAEDLAFRAAPSSPYASSPPRPSAHLAAETENLSSFAGVAPSALSPPATFALPMAVPVPAAKLLNACSAPTAAVAQARAVLPAPGPPGVHVSGSMRMVGSTAAFPGSNLCQSDSSVGETPHGAAFPRTASPQPSTTSRVHGVASHDGRPMTPVEGRRISPQEAHYLPGYSPACRSRPPMSPGPSTPATPHGPAPQSRGNIYATAPSAPLAGGGQPRSPMPAGVSPQQQQQQSGDFESHLARAPSPMYGGGIANGARTPLRSPSATRGTQPAPSMLHGHFASGNGGGTSSRAASPMPQRALPGSFVAPPPGGSSSRQASVTRTPPRPVAGGGSRAASPMPGGGRAASAALLPTASNLLPGQPHVQQGFLPQGPPPHRAVSPMRNMSPHPQVRQGSMPNLAWSHGSSPQAIMAKSQPNLAWGHVSAPQGCMAKSLVPPVGVTSQGPSGMRCASPMRMNPTSAPTWQYGGS